jgi:hypothetical protein
LADAVEKRLERTGERWFRSLSEASSGGLGDDRVFSSATKASNFYGFRLNDRVPKHHLACYTMATPIPGCPSAGPGGAAGAAEATAHRSRVELGDTVVPGQMLRVTRGCVKSWSVLCKVRDEGGISEKIGRPLKGTQRRTTLGQYPIMGVKAVREAPIAVQNHSANARVLRSRTEWRTPRRALLAAGQNRGTSSSLSTSLTT